MMGVSWVYQYKLIDGKAPSQAFQELKQYLESVGAKKIGSTSFDCELMQPQIDPRITTNNSVLPLYICHNSCYPFSTFAVLGDPLSSKSYIMADRMFDSLLKQCDSVYSVKHNSKMEFQGTKYELADFWCKVGTVVMGTAATVLGVLIEVEYRACDNPSACKLMMSEFTDSLFRPVLASVLPPYIEKRLSSGETTWKYTPINTVNQYLEHFHNFRQSSSGGMQTTLQQQPAIPTGFPGPPAPDYGGMSNPAFAQQNTGFPAR